MGRYFHLSTPPALQLHSPQISSMDTETELEQRRMESEFQEHDVR